MTCWAALPRRLRLSASDLNIKRIVQINARRSAITASRIILSCWPPYPLAIAKISLQKQDGTVGLRAVCLPVPNVSGRQAYGKKPPFNGNLTGGLSRCA